MQMSPLNLLAKMQGQDLEPKVSLSNCMQKKRGPKAKDTEASDREAKSSI